MSSLALRPLKFRFWNFFPHQVTYFPSAPLLYEIVACQQKFPHDVVCLMPRLSFRHCLMVSGGDHTPVENGRDVDGHVQVVHLFVAQKTIPRKPYA